MADYQIKLAEKESSLINPCSLIPITFCLHMLTNRLWEVMSQSFHRLRGAQSVKPRFYFLILKAHTGLAFFLSQLPIVVHHRWWILASLSQPFLYNLTQWNGKLSALSVLEPIAPPAVCWPSASSAVQTGRVLESSFVSQDWVISITNGMPIPFIRCFHWISSSWQNSYLCSLLALTSTELWHSWHQLWQQCLYSSDACPCFHSKEGLF